MTRTTPMPRTRLETRARSRALQALYAWDIRAGRETLPRIASQVWDDLAVPADERKLAGEIVRIVTSQGPALDRALSEVTTNWRLDRLGAIERSVLRLAAAELSRGDTPPRVVIQEAIHLAERYGSPRSAAFVNGVVDALARGTGRL